MDEQLAKQELPTEFGRNAAELGSSNLQWIKRTRILKNDYINDLIDCGLIEIDENNKNSEPEQSYHKVFKNIKRSKTPFIESISTTRSLEQVRQEHEEATARSPQAMMTNAHDFTEMKPKKRSLWYKIFKQPFNSNKKRNNENPEVSNDRSPKFSVPEDNETKAMVKDIQ